MKKVTMNLSEQEIGNIDQLAETFHTTTRKTAVTSALALAREILDIYKTGGTLMVKNQDGSMERLLIPGVKRN